MADRPRSPWVPIAALVVVLFVATPVLAATFTSTPTYIDQTVPIYADGGPNVTITAEAQTEANLHDALNTAAGEIHLETGQGEIVISGDSGAAAWIAVSDIEGTTTRATNLSGGTDWLRLNPGDKQAVAVRGDADSIAFGPISADDGSSDLSLTGAIGGTAELRLTGLNASTEYALLDGDRVLGTGTTDSGGVLQTYVDLPDGDQTIHVRTVADLGAPTVSNATPTGIGTDPVEQLQADVVADGYPVDVTFSLDGSTVGTTTLDSAGTATVDIDPALGGHDWSVTATDGAGQTTTASYSFETPASLTLREESSPQTIVDNGTTDVIFYTVNGDITIQRSVSDGQVNLTGLPDTEFVAIFEGPNHYTRSVYIPTIYEQQNIFLLNETVHPRDQNDAIRSYFLFEDLTGQFTPADTTIQIQRAIDVDGDGEGQWRTVSGAYWGAAGEYEAILQYNQRYRIVVINQETGGRQNLGAHVPTEDLTQTLRPRGVVENATEGTGVTTEAALVNNSIELAYVDPTNTTDALQVRVVEQAGDGVLMNTSVSGPLGEYDRIINLNDSQADSQWVVEFRSDRESVAIPVGSGGGIPLPIAAPGWVMTLLMAFAVTFVGALYGPRTATIGAWAMVFVASGAFFFGWAFGGPAIVLAWLVAIATTVLDAATPG